MKNLFILIAILTISFTTATAQGLSEPLKDKVTNEIIPTSPGEDYTYIKGHYELKAGKYYWVNGAYVKSIENSKWVDGEWVQDEETKLYSYSAGFWKIDAPIINFNGIAYSPRMVTTGSVLELQNDENFSMAIME